MGYASPGLLIDDVGPGQVNRWLALAQLDGWGEEYRLLAVIAARQIGCRPSDLMPYDGDATGEREFDPPPAEQTLAALGRLAGF